MSEVNVALFRDTPGIGEIVSEIENCFQSGYSLRETLELEEELRFR